MEVELDFRWVLQVIKQLKCKITKSIFEVVMRFDDRWLPETLVDGGGTHGNVVKLNFL